MRFTIVILGIFFALNASAQGSSSNTSESPSDEALIQAAEKMIQEGGKVAMNDKAASTAAATSASTEEKVIDRSAPEIPENEIAITMKPMGEVKAPADMTYRLLASMVFLVVVAGGMYFASRRWKRTPDKGGQAARIEMMHQFHVGPKRSIALIRVAGETMLVGITDHNINMLKSVALIDDELEGVIKKTDFNNFLEDEFSIEDVRSALRT